MKKIYLLLLLVVVTFKIQAQGNYSDFLPLQIGNIWVYQNYVYGNPPQCYPCSAKMRFQISATSQYNGHIYFQATQTGAGCLSPPIPFTSWLRVDSVTGNLLQYTTSGGCTWSPNVTMIDSFKARLHDTIRFNCNQPPGAYGYRTCTDTSNVILFGTSRQRRIYTNNGFEYGENRIYAKGIGLYYTGGGSVACQIFTRNLLGCVINGVVYGDTSMIVGIKQISTEIPNQFSLSQNYPNPFNPATKIRFALPKNSFAKLIVYDILGREVETLVSEQLNAGTYEVDWNASNYPSGVYYYKLTAGDYTETKKMVLVK